MSIHDDLDLIPTLETRIYEHIGYSPKWHVLPLDDRRDVFWNLTSDGTQIRFAPTKEKLLAWLTQGDDSGECYSDCILGGREGATPRTHGIFRGASITGIEVDTQTDGNMFLMLLRNENEVFHDED